MYFPTRELLAISTTIGRELMLMSAQLSPATVSYTHLETAAAAKMRMDIWLETEGTRKQSRICLLYTSMLKRRPFASSSMQAG